MENPGFRIPCFHRDRLLVRNDEEDNYPGFRVSVFTGKAQQDEKEERLDSGFHRNDGEEILAGFNKE